MRQKDYKLRASLEYTEKSFLQNQNQPKGIWIKTQNSLVGQAVTLQSLKILGEEDGVWTRVAGEVPLT